MGSLPNPIHHKDVTPVPMLPGIDRKPLAFNEDGNLNYFTLQAGSKIPLHQHEASQIGFILSGRVRFFTEDSAFIAETGHSYIVNRNQPHGADILQDTALLEFFSPLRQDYLP